MQPEDLVNAFSTFADKVDLMSSVVDRFNEKLASFNGTTVESGEHTTQPTEEALHDESAVAVPPTAVVEESNEGTPNSVLSLVEALSAWKGE